MKQQEIIAPLNDTSFYMDTVQYDRIYDPTAELGYFNIHCTVEINFVVSGTGFHRILNQMIPCQAGDVYVLNEHVPHNYYAFERESSITVRRILFSPRVWLNAKYASPTEPEFLYGCFRENKIMACAMLTQAVCKIVESLFDEIQVELQEKKDEWEEAMRAGLVRLLVSIARYVNRTIKTVPLILSDTWDPVSGAIAMIHEKYGDCNLTLETIAESLHFSRSYLSKLFKQITGETFSAFLRNVRMEGACSMLADTELTVKEIMNACGIRDIETFYKSFEEYSGTTPSNYRKQCLKERQSRSIMHQISIHIQTGNDTQVVELTQKALDESIPSDTILNEGFLAGMNVVGDKFKNNEIYIPEVLMAARAMNKGIAALKPHFAAIGIQATGRVCIGTVQGDLHDIGKNLVKVMMESRGLEVIDLGIDVPPETFVQVAIEQDCKVICCSALLTTTMGVMENVVKKAVELGVRDQVKIMIGGAPVDADFCKKIGADLYTPDAASAAAAAVDFCK